MQTDNIVLT